MKKIENDPLLTIFKNSPKEVYIEEIENIKNISNFFNFISSTETSEDSKIAVLENLLKIFSKNRYICVFFSSYNNKSIYLYLFDLYLSKSSSEKLKTTIINLLNEITIHLETNKEVYEYLFQSLSKIYNIEDTSQEKTPQNLYNHLTLLDTILAYKEKLIKPSNYFALSGKNKFTLNLNDNILYIGYCMSFMINFKIGDSQDTENVASLFRIKFSNDTSLSFDLKGPFLFIKEGKENIKMLKGLPPNEFVVLVINLIVEDGNLHAYYFVNGENNLLPHKYKNNLDLKKDFIEYLDFFDNFYGEVTSIAMFMQKEKANTTINSKEFLPNFKKYNLGFHKKKYLLNFVDMISDTPAIAQGEKEKDKDKDKGKSANKLINNLVFIFTPFNYFHTSWKNNKRKEQNKLIDDYFGKHKMIIFDNDNSIRNHRYQCYQKKIYLVCDITNFSNCRNVFDTSPIAN